MPIIKLNIVMVSVVAVLSIINHDLVAFLMAVSAFCGWQAALERETNPN